ncbi:MAG: hypothetical protein HQM09_15055 [Candidatus Riflebacteria bacterium]|nr:hypothetical protein [Candidatus Riflebacteria bacterium]
MGNKINETKPPDWFDLSKYDGVKDLDLRGWFTQFEVRREIWHFWPYAASSFLRKVAVNPIIDRNDEDPYGTWESGDPPLPTDAQFQVIEQTRAKLLAVEQKKLVNKDDDPYFSSYCREPWISRPVRPLTARDLLYFRKAIGRKRRKLLREMYGSENTYYNDEEWANRSVSKKAREFSRELDDERARVWKEKWAWIDEPVHWNLDVETPMAFMCFDLDFPDQLLRESFDKVLGELRKNNKTKSKHGNTGQAYFDKASELRKNNPRPRVRVIPSKVEDIFSKWIENAVLPYIDLMIWQRIDKKNKLSYTTIANTIRPLGGSSDLIRKTTHDLAMTALSLEFMQATERFLNKIYISPFSHTAEEFFKFFGMPYISE